MKNKWTAGKELYFISFLVGVFSTCCAFLFPLSHTRGSCSPQCGRCLSDCEPWAPLLFFLNGTIYFKCAYKGSRAKVDFFLPFCYFQIIFFLFACEGTQVEGGRGLWVWEKRRNQTTARCCQRHGITELKVDHLYVLISDFVSENVRYQMISRCKQMILFWHELRALIEQWKDLFL